MYRESNPMSSAGASHTILVVEDEPLMRNLLHKLLARAGTQTMLAADGAEALEIYERHQREISVVLLDLGLPKISGWDVFDKMKERNPHVHVVVATGFLEPKIKERLQSGGVKHFIHKPFNIDHLMGVLREEIRDAENHSAHAEHPPSEARETAKSPTMA